MRIATTGSIYLELRREREWVVIRIADHGQVYHQWMTTYSLSPRDLYFDEVAEVLGKPYGEVGDIL
jgi:hypothetical protein